MVKRVDFVITWQPRKDAYPRTLPLPQGIRVAAQQVSDPVWARVHFPVRDRLRAAL